MSNSELWVFGYGSLIWHPGFDHDETTIATLGGYHRSFCMRSIHHRGTEEKPGLVLALDAEEGASCQGVAFRVTPGTEDKTMAELRERELVSSAYLEKNLMLTLADGREVEAVTYVIDPDHVQYCHIELTEQAHIIATAVGGRGPNTDYLYNTADHLAELGIEDPDLTWLSARVREITEVLS
ncbi:gamma-glutamylcyclotransferase [Aliiroseovarius sp. KMU-50]|uniref:glutathione-specific gamma-glutamylcyclotransferase n=1 Tax=Aliiroseovarius salicola TaxID=3009082 RepID=A0ABT4W3X3_9RHOB|nr:gamma-glutamylcyclotransferase [Aliiroseovarius sp. KMU-50]MDA5095221.1 gamma-glutamylcyclotransferase [Aliiroseovarius sp. KMU-50]